MLKETLSGTTGQYELCRPGAHPKQPLRAWDAADEYLINYTSEYYPKQKIIILNDQFGTLGCALNQWQPSFFSDSFCAHEALTLNLDINQLQSLNSLKPYDELPHSDVALIKLPKNLSYLEYQLNLCFKAGIKTVLLAGMMKHLPKNILDHLQSFGEVNRKPFVKKATLFHLSLTQHTNPSYPKENTFLGTTLISDANVFGRDKLDPGARFFLEHLKTLPEAKAAADLCCGSGILGIQYAKRHSGCSIDFFDESYMSVNSSQLSFSANKLENAARFIWQDGLGNEPQSYDLILCNPPFHEAHTVGDHIAKRLFKQSKQALNTNGRLVVVGNRHLKYHLTLKKYFKQVEQLAANSKFVLLSAHG